MKTTTKIMMLFLAMTLTLAACSKDDDTGTVQVKVTDAPFPFKFVSEANVNITKVELKNEDKEYVTVFEGNAAMNMVQYRNGVTANLAVKSIPPGKYSGIRVTIEGAEVKLTNGETFTVQAGLNGTVNTIITPELVVKEGESQEILMDIDMSDSFSFSGNFFGGWITAVTQITGISSFNPDVRVANLEMTGSVSGTVKDTDGTVIEGAEVYVKYDYDGDGTLEEISTVTEADGSFKIIGLPAGQYTLYVDAKDANEVTTTVTVNVDAEVTVTVEVVQE